MIVLSIYDVAPPVPKTQHLVPNQQDPVPKIRSHMNVTALLPPPEIKRQQSQDFDQPSQTDTNVKHIVQMSFSSETNTSKYVALLVNDRSESRVLILNLSTQPTLSSSPSKVATPPARDFISLRCEYQHLCHQLLSKVTFNPKDDQFVCTSGLNEWKVWRLDDGKMKPA